MVKPRTSKNTKSPKPINTLGNACDFDEANRPINKANTTTADT